MSESQDTDAPLLPDDAEQKINELLEALHESEERMMEETSAKGAAPEVTDGEENEPAGDSDSEDLLRTEEGDFVDLDAEQLSNSSDVLQLDESDPLEENLIEGLSDESEGEGTLSVEDDESNDVFDAVSGFTGQEQQFGEPGPLVVPAPARATDAIPVWLSPMLAGLALLLSAVALWSTFNAPAPVAMPLAQSSDTVLLQGLNVDLAAFRERLSAVEKRAEAGEEAVVLFERMQGDLARIEQKLLSRNLPVESMLSPVLVPVAELPTETVTPIKLEQPETHPVAVQLTPETHETVAKVEATAPSDEAVAASSVTAGNETISGGKILIKGWAVNLRSFYYKVDAELLMQRYQQAGVAAEIRKIPKGSVIWYRVRVMGFASKKEANAFIAGLTLEQGREAAWPSYYKGYVEG